MKFSMLRKKVFVLAATLAAFSMFAVGAFAQAGTSGVSGTVTDPQGQSVVGATVTLVSVGQGGRRSVISDNNGNYSFTALQPGAYTLEVEAGGFNKAVTTQFSALVDSVTTMNIRLEIGDVNVSVTVDAGSIESIKNVSDGSLGNAFVSEQIVNLPLEGRNVTNLLSLQAGVTPSGAVAGGRSDQANITLDGIDVNNQQDAGAFSPVLRVTPDSIEEFRVTTSNPDATRGRSSGAQVSLITKSGSNDFHGNLFWYHRNDYFNANEWMNNANGIDRPKLLRNLFGGSFEGPIVKDRFFFFYNYEGMREAKSQGVTNLVPLASLGQGFINVYDNTGVLRTLDLATINALTLDGVPVVDVNPAVLSLFASAASRYPANSSLAGDGLNTGGFRFNTPLPVTENTHTAKFDWNITREQTHTANVRLNYQQDLYGRVRAFPDTPATDQWSHPSGLAANYTWLINNNLTNRLSFGITRMAFSNQGDSADNAITFRDIFSPVNFSRTFSRVNPTYNITDDMTWIKGNHTIQFGTNIRFVRNKRVSWGSAYDSAVTNYGFYQSSGLEVLTPIDQYLDATYGTSVGSAWIRSAQSSLSALIGRLNQYTARFNFDGDGNPMANSPTEREFATEEYDFYVQDSWKLHPSFTLNLGLRYGISTPVYEMNGLEAAPNIALDEYFARRKAFADMGLNYTEPIIINKSGKKNGADPMYNWDKNNWQPRVSFAWSPNFEGGLGAFIFGKNRSGVLRGGFSVTNDYYGQQLAVSFDASNTLGFLSNYTTPANTFNITTNPAPLWDGTGMNIQGFPGVVPPSQLVFPLQQPEDLGMRIESSIDRGVQAPVHYSTNLTFGRELPSKLYFEASYISRRARKLLATRDVMSPNNLRDPLSGMTYYEAARILAEHNYAGGSLATVPTVSFFENMWPALHGTLTNSQLFFAYAQGSTDFTWPQYVFDAIGPEPMFYQPQYGALSSFGSISNSDYHAGTLSVRQRLSNFTWDLNYTFSHSMDDTSGVQTSTAFGAAFILNPIRQEDNYASSDFDMRHIVNFNSIWQVPIGRGRQFLSDANPFVDAVLGGWQLTSIFRYNSGQPIGTGGKIFDNSGWVTNWNLKSAMVQTRPVQTGVYYNGEDGLPSMFADRLAAYQSFRSPYPGETGDRNQIRYPSFWTMDLGLQKSFTMPWREGHKVSLRWDVFNVTNTPIFAGNNNTAMGFRPSLATEAPTGFGVFSGTRSDARVMQFAFRYDF